MNQTTTETYIDLAFCIDCAMLHANGEVPEDWADIAVADWLGYIEQNLDGLYGVHVGDGEPETFSSSSCDSCGSMLAGSRHHGGAWLAN